MKKLQVQQFKKQLMILGAASLIAVPGLVYAQRAEEEDTATTVVSEEDNTTDVTNPYPLPEAETSDPVIEFATETTEDPVAPEDPETEVVQDGVTLGEAQLIAQAEHSESTIVKTKIKTVDGNAVYAFYFADGWKVYVQAIDGQVVRVFDASDKKHDCKNKKFNDGKFQSWLQSRKTQRRENRQASQAVQVEEQQASQERQSKRTRGDNNNRQESNRRPHGNNRHQNRR